MKYYDLEKGISREKAKFILKRLNYILERYGAVTLADLYDLVGDSGYTYLDSKKIWHSLDGSKVSLTRRKGRYRIILPDYEEEF